MGMSSTSASATAQRIKSLLRETTITTASGTGGSSTRSLLPERDDARRLDDLRRLFGRLVDDDEFDPSPAVSSSDVGRSDGGATEATTSARWNAWLLRRRDDFVAQLCHRIKSNGRLSSIRTLCGTAACCPVRAAANGDDGRMIDERLVHRLVESVASLDVGNDHVDVDAALALIKSEFVGPYLDARYFVLCAVRKVASDLYDRQRQRRRRKRRSEKRTKDDDDDDDDDEEEEEGTKAKDSAAADVLARLLLMVDMIKTDEDASNGSYLFPPPVRSIKDEDDEDEDEGENNGSDSDDDSKDEDSEEDDDSADDDNDDESAGDDDTRGVAGSGKHGRADASGTASPVAKRFKAAATAPRSFAKPVSWLRAARHRRALQEAWLAVLRLPGLPLGTAKRTLRHIPSAVLPHCSSPLRFAEYFTKSYELGGVSSVLALHGLFVLMTEHGLEHPKFYTSLYRLLKPGVLYAKHRTRFLQLLVRCLHGGQMLPAYVVAAFCKRLCRLALSGPPSGALFTVALVSNLLRRHGECGCLVHRGTGGRDGLVDAFDNGTDDPAKSRALESSLWELAALERHYHPAVSALAKACGTEDDKTPMHVMDEFLAHTYKSLFDQERKRIEQKKGARRPIPLTFQEPKSLFGPDDVFSRMLHTPERQRPGDE